LLTTLIFGALPLKVAQAEGITTTLSMTAPGTKVAIDPVLNKVYVLTPSIDIVTVINGATHTQTTAVTGQNPVNLALNPATGKVYIANRGTDNVTVLDGSTNTTTTIATGAAPNTIAINPTTNQIYVTCANDNTVTVIDGDTNTTSTIALQTGANPRTVVVNPVTNKIYVINDGDYSITIIDGATKATNTITPISTVPYPLAYAAAVNPITNKLYVANNNLGTVSVIDGSTLAVTQIAVGATPNFVAVNPVTNKIYVACADGDSVTVINGSDNTTTSIEVGANPFAMTINPTTNQIYVASWSSANIWHIDGNTNTLAYTIATANTPNGIAINPITNQLYAANESALTVVDGASNVITATLGISSAAPDMAYNPITNELYVIDGGVVIVDGNTHAASPISVGSPSRIAINTVTNKIYVTSVAGKSVTVIDGVTHTTTPINIGMSCYEIVVNFNTNKIYANFYNDGGLVVIDGATNNWNIITPNAAAIADSIQAIAVNPITNRLYALGVSDKLYVLDGATDTTLATIPTPSVSAFDIIAINPITNKIYFNLANVNKVAILDGITNNLTSIPTATWPVGVAVNPFTNKIYIHSRGAVGVVTVLDGGTNTTQTISGLPELFHAIAVNPITNKVYIPSFASGTNSVMIDGITNAPTSISETASMGGSLAINLLANQIYISKNAATSSLIWIINEQNVQNLPLTVDITPLPDHIAHTGTPTFAFAPASAYSPAIQNVFYQVDTWTGPWRKATFSGGTWAGTTPFLQIGTHVMYAYASDSLEASSFDPSNANAQPVGKISAYGFNVLPTDTLYVDDDYTAATPGWNYDRFASIATALQTVPVHGTVIVNPGTYPETLTLAKDITLKTEGAVILTGALTLNAGTFNPNPDSSLTITGDFTQGAATSSLSTATLAVGGNFVQNNGTFNLNTGTLALSNTFTRSGGAFNVDTGTLALNGHATQVIPSGISPYNLNIQTTDYGLAGYWPMDEGSGTTIADASGSGNPATLNGATWAGSNAPIRFINPSALNLSTNAYVQAPHANTALDFGTDQDFSTALWVKKSAPTSPYANILSNQVSVFGTHPGFALTADQYADRWVATLSDGTHTVQVTGGLIADQEWHHLAATFDRDGMLSLYQDGAFVANTSLAGVTNVTTGLPISIGNYTGSGNAFAGALDDLRIYNRLLSASDLSILSGGLKPGSVTLSEALDVNGSLAIGAGSTLDVSTTNCSGAACPIHLAGNWNNNGEFSPRGGAVHFDGGKLQTLTGTGMNDFATLTLSGAATIVDDQSTPAATAATFSASPNGARLRRTETIRGLGGQTFGLTGVTLNVTDNSFSTIRIDRVQGSHPDAAGTIVSGRLGLRTGQYWTIAPTGTGTVDIILPQANLPGTLMVCRYLGPTAPDNRWDCAVADATTLSTATRNEVSSFSDWAAGNDINPTTIRLSQFEAHSAATRNAWFWGLSALALLALVLARETR
jgi:YVTN family beta-propeller protein